MLNCDVYFAINVMLLGRVTRDITSDLFASLLARHELVQPTASDHVIVLGAWHGV